MIKYEDIEPYLLDYIKGEVEESHLYRIKAYLAENPDYQDEIDRLKETLHYVQETPLIEPDNRLKMSFYAMLNQYPEGLESEPSLSFREKILAFFTPKDWAGRLALASVVIVIFLSGYLTSFWLNQENQTLATVTKTQKEQQQNQLADLAEEKDQSKAETKIQEPVIDQRTENTEKSPVFLATETESSTAGLRRMELPIEMERTGKPVALMAAKYDAPLGKAASSDRIEELYALQKEENNASKIVNALIEVLNTDPNPNVRMAAIDVLERFLTSPEAKIEFVKSLMQQNSPSLQFTALDLIVKYNIIEAREAIKVLLQKTDIDEEVRAQAEIALNILS